MSLESINARKIRVAQISIVSNTCLIIGKLVTGIVMGSVAVISDAAHSGMDLIASLIAYFSVKKASQPADNEHPYGHGKIENISATLEAVLIFVVAGYIIYEAYQRLNQGYVIEALGLGMAVMVVASIVNWLVSSYVMKVAKETDSIALEASAWHLRTDVYTSIGVFFGLGAIYLTGWYFLDSIVGILVALMILKTAWDLTRRSVNEVLDARLPEEEEKTIIDVLERHAHHYVEFHKLRTRKAGSERHIDLHLVVKRDLTIEEVHNLCNHLEDRIADALANTHVLIHVEPCTVALTEPCEPAEPTKKSCMRCQSSQFNKD